MSDIKSLAELNIPYIILGTFIIIVCIVYIIDVLGRFKNQIGKPMGWIGRNNADHEELLRLSEEVKEFKEQRAICMSNVNNRDQEIENKIDLLTNMFIDKQIDDYRWEIINAADKITNGRNLSRDAYQHCFNTYERYEQILKDYNKTNHEVDVSMDIIRKSYQEKLVNGFNYRVNNPQGLNNEKKDKTELIETSN